ncbi:divergent polysaccharide deacetylase family protein [Arenibaculum pallidiluteum]|uniref:divergent polysaccharide deacetylase family protein n=1 Tax=Arenibaculum pallidiluteum TaxID=2812559 RepID=UPI001F3112EE|nr:divergent polysaccharide deacetylase family protein [Arenibaculum pallidiluteum]
MLPRLPRRVSRLVPAAGGILVLAALTAGALLLPGRGPTPGPLVQAEPAAIPDAAPPEQGSRVAGPPPMPPAPPAVEPGQVTDAAAPTPAPGAASVAAPGAATPLAVPPAAAVPPADVPALAVTPALAGAAPAAPPAPSPAAGDAVSLPAAGDAVSLPAAGPALAARNGTAPTMVAMLPPPVPGNPGVPAWQRNAVAANWPAGRPAIAVVIDDMGVDRRRSTQVVALPAPLTLSWLPYASELPRQTAAAQRAGHELMVHLPMQPQAPDQNPGPGAMLVGLDPGEIGRRIDAALGAFEGHVGLNNHMGSRFTEDRAGMAAVLAALQRRGLLFLDSRTSGRSVGMEVAARHGVPAVGRDVFIDHDPAPAAIRHALERMEAIARRHGYAVGIGHPHDATIAALADWLPRLAAKGFAVVPVSAVVRARLAPNG